MIHELKIKPEYFADVVSGKKTFEVRKGDRPFKVGDLLALNEFENQSYTGASCLVYIDYILNDKELLKSGYVVMSIKPVLIRKSDSPLDFSSHKYDYSVPLATERDGCNG